MFRKAMALLCLLAVGGNALAGSCGVHGYSSSGGGHGTSYWQGGYFAGNQYYKAGYYSPGYYADYPAKKVVVEPVFLKYVAVVPLVELPTYGAYYQTYPQAQTAAQAPAAPQASASDGKLDRLLALAESTSGRITKLEARVQAIESGGGRQPLPTPPAAGSARVADVPSLLFNKCASCHESRVSARLGGRLTFFVADDKGATMAGVDAAGKPTTLSTAVLKRIERSLADNSMPPEKDATGKPVPPLTAQERKDAIEFLRQAIAAGPR